ncbi:MAG: hypothetical protein N3A54_06905, partial [Patescibacteria group bacterium]|nr:hypothetical protein [Patescibacteria group bacterium]
LGVYLFLEWISREKILLLLGSFLCFFITLGIYQAPRAFLPIFLPILMLITFKKKKKYLFLLVLLYFLFILLPNLLIFLNKNLSTRIQTLSIWSTQETQLIVDEQIREDGVQGVHPRISRLVHNKAIGYIETFLTNYFRHLTYDFLFTDQGLPDRYRVPHSGLFYITMLPVLLLGVFYILFHERKKGIFLITWISVSIVGSALTFDDVPNLQRTLIAVPVFSILMSMGLYSIFLIQNRLRKFLILSIITIFLIFEGYRYLHHYYVQQVVHRPWYRQEGYKELVTNIEKIQSDYKQIVVTNRESAPTVFFLFYTKYDPKKFQNETKNSAFRDFDRINFSNYIFSEEQCPLKEILYKDNNNQEITDCFFKKETLYVNSGFCEVPKVCAKVLKIIKRNDGTPVFQILEPNDDKIQ